MVEGFAPVCTPIGPRPAQDEQRPLTSASVAPVLPKMKPPTPHPSTRRTSASADLLLQGQGKNSVAPDPKPTSEAYEQVGPAVLPRGMNFGEAWNEAMHQRGDRLKVALIHRS